MVGFKLITLVVIGTECTGSCKKVRVRIMVFNTTYNNISIISWQSVLLVEKTGVPGEHH